MSALLNHNEIRYVPWKGKPFNQITSIIQKNKNSPPTDRGDTLKPGPLKIYRRELATNTSGTSCSRISSSIDVINRPNGYTIPGTVLGQTGGLVNTLDFQLPNSKQETNRCEYACKSQNSVAENAKRRCRSSGNITKKIDPARNDHVYFTNTNQYLVSRTKTFTQNQYRHVRHKDESLFLDPNNETDKGQFYSPNGLSHCPKTYYDGVLNPFEYIWLNGTTYSVQIKAGYYDVHDLNSAFEVIMIENGHYYINLTTGSKVCLLKIIYNDYSKKIELQTFSTTGFNNQNYVTPNNNASHWPNTLVPQFNILANEFQNLIGFSSGVYPISNIYGINVGILSNMGFTLTPSYSIVTYKPNNSRFGQQGGASSSSLVARKKYDTITNVASSYNNVYGSEVANAMSYGVSEQVYTLKSKIGYPTRKTPIISRITGEMTCKQTGC